MMPRDSKIGKLIGTYLGKMMHFLAFTFLSRNSFTYASSSTSNAESRSFMFLKLRNIFDLKYISKLY